MRIEPLGDKIVVKRMEAEETTAGGIVLPESAKEKPQQGRVLSVGEGFMLKDGNRAKPQLFAKRTVGRLVVFQVLDRLGDHLLIMGRVNRIDLRLIR